MDDQFKHHAPGTRTDPGQFHAAVTPSDDEDLPVRPRALYIGNGGDLALRDAAGTELIRRNVPSGAEIAFSAVRVLATGTTAADILAIW